MFVDPHQEDKASASGKVLTLAEFNLLQQQFYERLNQSAGDTNSLVRFTLKVLQYCLKHINYQGLITIFDFKNKTREKEYFRYLHLLVDLSASKINHLVLMHPYLIRDVLGFVLNSESENILHYHRIFDCRSL